MNHWSIDWLIFIYQIFFVLRDIIMFVKVATKHLSKGGYGIIQPDRKAGLK